MSNNHLDNFEKFLQDSLEQHEVPYNPADWSALESKLNASPKAPFYKSPWFIAASVTVLVGAASMMLFTTTTTTPSETTNEVAEDISSASPESNITLIEDTEKEVTETPNKVEPGELSESPSENTEKENNTISETKEQSESGEIASNQSNPENDQDDNQLPYDPGYDSPDSDVQSHNNTPPTEVIPEPTSDFFMNLSEGCEGTTVRFTTGEQEDVDFLWSFGDGQYSKSQNPTHEFKRAGSYLVNLIVRSQKDNSVMSKSQDQLITIHPKPKVNFSYETLTNNGIPSTAFINMTDKATNWNWNFGDGNISNEKDPNHTYRKKGQYLVTLTASNNNGCVSTVKQEVMINQDYNLLAPNSFTPNGDGINDDFLPAALLNMDCSFTMTVYGTSQGLVYETKNIDRPWDGYNLRNGSKCGEGSYVWVVKLINDKGETEQYKGAVLLLK